MLTKFSRSIKRFLRSRLIFLSSSSVVFRRDISLSYEPQACPTPYEPVESVIQIHHLQEILKKFYRLQCRMMPLSYNYSRMTIKHFQEEYSTQKTISSRPPHLGIDDLQAGIDKTSSLSTWSKYYSEYIIIVALLLNTVT